MGQQHHRSSPRLVRALVIATALLVAVPAAAQASTVLAPSAQLSSTAAGVGGVDYLFGFTTSAAGGLTANSGTITVAAPSGTIFPQNFQTQLRDVTANTSLGVTGNVTFQNGQSTATWTVSSAVPAGHLI